MIRLYCCICFLLTSLVLPSFVIAQDAKKLVANDVSVDQVRFFSIEQADKDGRLKKIYLRRDKQNWKIDSHYRFPVRADGFVESQINALLKLSAKRELSRDRSAHETLGVVNPRDVQKDKWKSAGTLVQLYDSDHARLADLIIGRPIAPDAVPVRHAEKATTSLVFLNVEFKADLYDWIEFDPLKFATFGVKKVVVEEVLGAATRNTEGQWPRFVFIPERKIFTIHQKGEFPITWDSPDLKTDEEISDSSLYDFFKFLSLARIKDVVGEIRHANQPLLNSSMELIGTRQIRNAPRDLEFQLESKGFRFCRRNDKVYLAGRNRIAVSTSKGIEYEIHLGKRVEDELGLIDFDKNCYFVIFRARLNESVVDPKLKDREKVLTSSRRKIDEFNKTYSNWVFTCGFFRSLPLYRERLVVKKAVGVDLPVDSRPVNPVRNRKGLGSLEPVELTNQKTIRKSDKESAQPKIRTYQGVSTAIRFLPAR